MMHFGRFISFTIFISLLAWISGEAKEIMHLMRSPYALLMGDAFTARADDEYTLFYNPAALGRNAGLRLSPLNPTVGIVSALDDIDRFKDFSETKDSDGNYDAAKIGERLMGFPVYIHAGASPSMKFGPMGMVLFASTSSSIIMRNNVHPMMDVDYRLDRGFIVGFAHSIGNGAKSTSGDKTTPGQRLSIGVALKKMNRQGLDNSYDLFGSELMANIAQASGGDLVSLRNAMGYSKGKAWGGDLGLEWIHSTEYSELSWGLSILDINDTRFRKLDGTQDIPRQEMYINTGITWRQDFTLLDYSFSMDLHPINVVMPWQRKLHIGFDIGIPLIRVMAGLSEGYISYGATVSLWPFKITAGFYGVELGSEYKQEKGSRAFVYISLLDFAFEI
jgi:hypothetical protein